MGYGQEFSDAHLSKRTKERIASPQVNVEAQDCFIFANNFGNIFGNCFQICKTVGNSFSAALCLPKITVATSSRKEVFLDLNESF